MTIDYAGALLRLAAIEDQLWDLVEEAYREGWQDGSVAVVKDSEHEDVDWQQSRAIVRLRAQLQGRENR